MSTNQNKLYFKAMDRRIQHLLFLKENESTNIDKTIDSLISELIGYQGFVYHGEEYGHLYEILKAKLNSLKSIDDFAHYRREVFKCKNICQQLAEK